MFAENVRQAFQFAQTGNADVALTALTLAAARRRLIEIAESEHPPLVATPGVVRGGMRGAGAAGGFYPAPRAVAICAGTASPRLSGSR